MTKKSFLLSSEQGLNERREATRVFKERGGLFLSLFISNKKNFKLEYEKQNTIEMFCDTHKCVLTKIY